MDQFNIPIDLRWADLDPNFHVRHSVYYDYGAYCRIQFLEACNITAGVMQELGFGPVIFREECVFKKELHLSDKLTIDMQLVKARKDGSRWTMQHQVFKNNEILSAVITLDGAWMDIRARKLCVPPPIVQKSFESGPKTEFFEWIG